MADFPKTVALYYAGLLPESAILFWDSLSTWATCLASWDINLGEAQSSVLGSRFTHIVGGDNKLVFNPTGWLMGPGRRNPITDFVLGLGNDVNFVYGARISATYGGPVSNITRGPRYTKVGGAPLKSEGIIPDPVAGLWKSVKSVYNDKTLGKDLAPVNEDRKVFLGVTALGACLTLVTALTDFWIRLAYEKTDAATGKLVFTEKHPSITSRLGSLEMAHRMLPRRLQAVIYHLEVAGTWSLLGDALKNGCVAILKKARDLLILASGIGILWKLSAGVVKKGLSDSKNLVLRIKAIIIMLVLILVIILKV